MDDAFRLPHGARGFDIEQLAIEFRDDKIVLMDKRAGDHYTVHIGNNSGMLDVHRTWRDEHGQEQHQTVFAIRHEAILALLNELSGALTGIMRLLRPLRLGWLGHHQIGVVRGLVPMTTEEIANVTRKRGKRLVPAEDEQWRKSITAPNYLAEVWDFPDGAFSLFDGGEHLGIGFKTTDHHGKKRLYWVKLHDMMRFFNSMNDTVLEAAQRYAIPSRL